jgi:hypothetical protein
MREKILYPSTGVRIFSPLMGIAAGAAGWRTASNHHLTGWLLLICSAIWLLAGLVNLLPRATFLRLTKEGLCLSTLFFRQELKWEDVADFRCFQFNSPGGALQSSFRARTYVVADISPDAKHPPKNIEASRRRYGCDFFFPFTFGMSAQQLADLLNKWRQQRAAV